MAKVNGEASPWHHCTSTRRLGSAIPSTASGSKQGRGLPGHGPQKRPSLAKDRPLFTSGLDLSFVALAENS